MHCCSLLASLFLKGGGCQREGVRGTGVEGKGGGERWYGKGAKEEGMGRMGSRIRGGDQGSMRGGKEGREVSNLGGKEDRERDRGRGRGNPPP